MLLTANAGIKNKLHIGTVKLICTSQKEIYLKPSDTTAFTMKGLWNWESIVMNSIPVGSSFGINYLDS